MCCAHVTHFLFHCSFIGQVSTPAGIATSLKVLFEEDSTVEFDRNEVIALVNLLGRLSESVDTIRRLSVELRAQEKAQDQKVGDEYGAIKGLTGGGKAKDIS